MTEPTDDFKELVKDALTHLYDIGHLQTHPIVDILAIPEDRLVAGGRARAVRQVLFNAIEALKPGNTGSLQDRVVRTYKLLSLRYIEGIKAQDVALQLSLSDRQYFRELEKAIDELSQLLWHKIDPNHNNVISQEVETTVVSEALHLSQNEKERWFDLWEVVQVLIEDLRQMLDERKTSIIIRPGSSNRVPIFTSRTLMRQLLLTLLLEASNLYTGKNLEIRCQELSEFIRVEIFPDHVSSSPAKDMSSQLRRSSEFSGLLSVLHAQLIDSSSRPGGIDLLLPTSRWNILIVDDNQATLHLYRRFLATENCRIFEASGVSAALQFLKQTSVIIHLIIMDVMMPNQDGWEGLQKIRVSPKSQEIPVVICSVLNQPDLAFSLGAAGFLPKPVKQNDLVNILHQYLYRNGQV